METEVRLQNKLDEIEEQKQSLGIKPAEPEAMDRIDLKTLEGERVEQNLEQNGLSIQAFENVTMMQDMHIKLPEVTPSIQQMANMSNDSFFGAVCGTTSDAAQELGGNDLKQDIQYNHQQPAHGFSLSSL